MLLRLQSKRHKIDKIVSHQATSHPISKMLIICKTVAHSLIVKCRSNLSNQVNRQATWRMVQKIIIKPVVTSDKELQVHKSTTSLFRNWFNRKTLKRENYRGCALVMMKLSINRCNIITTLVVMGTRARIYRCNSSLIVKAKSSSNSLLHNQIWCTVITINNNISSTSNNSMLLSLLHNNSTSKRYTIFSRCSINSNNWPSNNITIRQHLKCSLSW